MEIVLAKLRYHLSGDGSKVGDNLHGDRTLIFFKCNLWEIVLIFCKCNLLEMVPQIFKYNLRECIMGDGTPISQMQSLGDGTYNL